MLHNIAARIYWRIKNQIRALNSALCSIAFNLSFNTTGCSVHSNCEVYGLEAIQIGKNFKSREGLWLHAISRYENQLFSPRIIIGDNVALSKNVHIASITSIKIEDDVLIGSNVLITDHNHGLYGRHLSPASKPSEQPRLRHLSGLAVVIERNVFIGDGCIILPGSYICEGSIIGSGSIVNGYIEASSIAVGRPAKVIKLFNPNSESWEDKS